MVPLRDDLRPDQDIDLVIAHLTKECSGGRRTLHGIAGQDPEARFGMQRRDLFGEALDAGTAGGHAAFRPAFGTDLRQCRAMAAMVTFEVSHEAMLDEPCRSIRALPGIGRAACRDRVGAYV